MNQLFQTSNTGVPSEYGEIEETIAPIALQTMGDWIVGRQHSPEPEAGRHWGLSSPEEAIRHTVTAYGLSQFRRATEPPLNRVFEASH